MRISSGTLNVGLTPVQVDGNSVQPAHIHIRNNDTTKTLFIGNSTVSTTNGLPVDKLATIEFTLPPGEALFMVSESGTHSVSFLRITE
jgi:ABC-type uncharacterized transport system fused permease/ATPase subunit